MRRASEQLWAEKERTYHAEGERIKERHVIPESGVEVGGWGLGF